MPEYAVVRSLLPNALLKCALLQRSGTVVAELSLKDKTKFKVGRGVILLIDATDYDRSEQGVANVLEVIDDLKVIKRLQKDGIIPSQANVVAGDVSNDHSKRGKKNHFKEGPQRGQREGGDDSDEEEGEDVLRQQEPDFGDEVDADRHDDDKEAAAEAEVQQTRGKGVRLSKAEQKALKLEAQEQPHGDSYLVTKALTQVDGHNENLDDI